MAEVDGGGLGDEVGDGGGVVGVWVRGVDSEVALEACDGVVVLFGGGGGGEGKG